jgi:hypothetical protein
VLSQRRAARLAWRAGRPRRDGSRGLLARPAWNRLVLAGDAGDQAAAEAVWRAWLSHPDDERWELLTRWRPPSTAEAACTAASTGNHAVAAFCVRRGLTPADPVRRAAFFLLTGQAAQSRAADPDGALLTLAYAGADKDERARLRAAMAGVGDLDLVRVVARGDPRLHGQAQHGQAQHGQAQHGQALTSDEARYLTEQLARRRDWAGLWRLVQGMTVLAAVTTARSFGDDWRPPGDHDRALFERLREADPDSIKTARAALAELRAVRVEMDGIPATGAFSPDGRRLVVSTGPLGTQGSPRTARPSGAFHVFELPAGRLIERFDVPGCYAANVVDLGEAFFASGWAGPGMLRPGALARYEGGRTTVLYPGFGWLPVAPHRGGLVAVAVGVDTQTMNPAGLRLRFCTPRGRQIRDVVFRDQHGHPVMFQPRGDMVRNNVVSHDQLGHPVPFRSCWPLTVAADPGGRRFAVIEDGVLYLWVLDTETGRGLIGPNQLWRATGACFCGPDRLVVCANANGGCRMALYRFAGDGVEFLAERIHPPNHVRCRLVMIPRRGEIAMLCAPPGPGGMRYFDAQTLAEVTGPGELARASRTALWSSPDGRHYALGGVGRDGQGEVQVTLEPDGVLGLVADRPAVDAVPADLAAVRSALRGTTADWAAWPLLSLLRDRLEHRFGADVALGATAPVGRDDDIGLRVPGGPWVHGDLP